MSDKLINRAAVRRLVHSRGRRLASDLVPELERRIEDTVNALCDSVSGGAWVRRMHLTMQIPSRD